MALFLPYASSAMDFSSVGSVQPVDGGFRARVRLSINGSCKLCPGPRRPDEEAAKEDLESMRAAASGMSREDGCAAMKAEADELKAGKPARELGFIEGAGKAFRAHVYCYRRPSVAGALSHVPLRG